jgi:hypothetical protein
MTTAHRSYRQILSKAGAQGAGTARSWLVAWILTLAFSLLPLPSSAVEPVSGRFLSAYGRTIILEYRILYPPPASLIVEQYFPPGHEIVRAFPMPQKYSRNLGKMKWIFKDLRPGSHTITVEFNWPVQASDLQATLRYRYPGRGLYTETTVLP